MKQAIKPKTRETQGTQKYKQEYKLTWKQFKELLENAGIQDTDEIDDIDLSWGDLNDFECYKDEVFGWKVRL